MNDQKLSAGKISKARYEFRTFGRNFSESAKLMEQLSDPIPKDFKHRISNEIYIISRSGDNNNIKIRDKMLDIKTYVQTVNGFEQWQPFLKEEFPINKAVLINDVFSVFNVRLKNISKAEISFNNFIQIIKECEELQAINLIKERFGYLVNNTICEVADVMINGTKLVTISSESTKIDDILKTIQDVKLEDYENINYIQMIKRVIGMINKPLAN